MSGEKHPAVVHRYAPDQDAQHDALARLLGMGDVHLTRKKAAGTNGGRSTRHERSEHGRDTKRISDLAP